MGGSIGLETFINAFGTKRSFHKIAEGRFQVSIERGSTVHCTLRILISVPFPYVGRGKV